jgi:hypothetical protein
VQARRALVFQPRHQTQKLYLMVVRGLHLPGQMDTFHCILKKMITQVSGFILKFLMRVKAPVTLTRIWLSYMFFPDLSLLNFVSREMCNARILYTKQINFSSVFVLGYAVNFLSGLLDPFLVDSLSATIF